MRDGHKECLFGLEREHARVDSLENSKNESDHLEREIRAVIEVNMKIKEDMAVELYRMGLGVEAVGRILHISIDTMREWLPMHHEGAKRDA